MRVLIAYSLVAFTASVTGLRILTPAIGDKVPQSDEITVKWQAVSTDPATMDIYLVNQHAYPNTQELVASDVDTSLGSYTIKADDVKDVDTGGGYQVNFVSSADGGILAQSQQFKSKFICICISVDFHNFHGFHDLHDFRDFHAFYFHLSFFGHSIDFFDFCFLYSFDNSFNFPIFFDCYSHLHQCVYPYHISLVYCFTYFYFYPHFIFYEDFLYECVHLYSIPVYFLENFFVEHFPLFHFPYFQLTFHRSYISYFPHPHKNPFHHSPFQHQKLHYTCYIHIQDAHFLDDYIHYN
ncbi:uncharacterized protein N7459_001364 [Penicillium hispanicum]|uniref:uncharacterized protein n=1 Tax=Penicillium hispanicum TaxID=1080232 RepID=UPI0025411CA0|nr:uncharacterized protein N7459_001364 [Penicillium hispanicum]KAJ5595156.1 hypothetical protein N7459_001364 [Penicillium hispanicum]